MIKQYEIDWDRIAQQIKQADEMLYTQWLQSHQDTEDPTDQDSDQEDSE